jgi:hypothetical protein
MNQTDSGRGNKIICLACNQEGQRITCVSGTKSEVIVYHPEKIFRTVCHVAGDKTMESQTETIEGEKRERHETDTAQAM